VTDSRTPSQEDLDVIERQLGRTPRDVHAISYRCPCGNPAVVETPPRLSNGEPFPTFYYATCPRLTAAISTLETTGLMGDLKLMQYVLANMQLHMMITLHLVMHWESMFQR
jgi:hypothetical protein